MGEVHKVRIRTPGKIILFKNKTIRTPTEIIVHTNDELVYIKSQIISKNIDNYKIMSFDNKEINLEKNDNIVLIEEIEEAETNKIEDENENLSTLDKLIKEEEL